MFVGGREVGDAGHPESEEDDTLLEGLGSSHVSHPEVPGEMDEGGASLKFFPSGSPPAPNN